MSLLKKFSRYSAILSFSSVSDQKLLYLTVALCCEVDSFLERSNINLISFYRFVSRDLILSYLLEILEKEFG